MARDTDTRLGEALDQQRALKEQAAERKRERAIARLRANPDLPLSTLAQGLGMNEDTLARIAREAGLRRSA